MLRNYWATVTTEVLANHKPHEYATSSVLVNGVRVYFDPLPDVGESLLYVQQTEGRTYENDCLLKDPKGFFWCQ